MTKMHIDGGFHQVERTQFPEEAFEMQLDPQNTEEYVEQARVLIEKWLRNNIACPQGSGKMILRVRVGGEIVEIVRPLAESSEETERIIDKIRYAATVILKQPIYFLKPRSHAVLAFLVEQGQTTKKFWTVEEIAKATGYEEKSTRTTLYEVNRYLQGLGKHWKMEGDMKTGWRIVHKKEYAPKPPKNTQHFLLWQKFIQGKEEFALGQETPKED